MKNFTLIHLSLGGCPAPELSLFFPNDQTITAEYWNGLNKVGEEAAPMSLAMALCSPWFEGDAALTCGEKTTRVKADWHVDFGRAKNLETKMEKALLALANREC